MYAHYRPVLVDTVVSRGEFLTSYTPYQAEIAQGTLTTIFEFQTMICQGLTGMDVANASMSHDGSTATPEAAMMAVRATGRPGVLVARTVHPEYAQVLRTYARNQGMPVEDFGYDARTGLLDLEDLERKITDTTAAVIIQSPNFFGVVENVNAAAQIAHAKGALLVFMFTEAVSLGLLEPPGRCRHRRGRDAIVRHSPELWRSLRRHYSGEGTSCCARCPEGWWERPPIRAVIARSVSRLPRASSISGVRRPPPISVRIRR